MSLEKNLKILIQKKGIKIKTLASIVQISEPTIKGWISGKQVRNINQLKRLTDYFNITIDEIYFGIKENKNTFQDFEDEINAGFYEVILRKVKK